MNKIIESANLLLSLQVGAREALALGVILEKQGRCTSLDIVNAFTHTTRAPLAVAAQLRNKGLVRRATDGAWVLTADGVAAVIKATEPEGDEE